jgi:DNA polymerase-3 subunit beta
LQRVKLEVLPERTVLMATDLEVGIRYAVPGVEVQAPGAVVLPIAQFGSILRESMDEKIRVEASDQGISIFGERSQFKLQAEDPHEFPAVAEFTETSLYEVSGRLFREMIHRTVFATDNESSRYALGGVKLEWTDDILTAIGTDGRRLAKMEGPGQKAGEPAVMGEPTIVPTSAMQLIERVLAEDDSEVQIIVRQNEVLVRNPRATIYARLLEGRFPRWREVFPNRQNSVAVQMVVRPLLMAVRQAMIATSKDSRGVVFTFGSGSLVLSGNAADVGQSRVELPIGYDGELFSVTLDPRYVADFLRVLEPDVSFTMDLAGSGGAAVCATNDGYSYVIMPLAKDR